MEFKFKEEAEEELPLEVASHPTRTGYTAVVGISFDRYNARVEAGEEIPPEYLVDDFIFDWLLNTKGVIKN